MIEQTNKNGVCFGMSPYDILMLVVFGGSILFGLWKGLAWQVASIAAIVASYFVALNFKQPLISIMGTQEPWAPFAAMLILFLVTSLGIWLAYGYIRESIQRMHLKTFDAQVGGLLGAFKGALLCMVITMFAVTLLGDTARRYVVGSYSGNLIARSINRLNAIVPNEFHQILDPFVNRFNEQLAKPLPPTSNSSTGSSGLAGQFSEMIRDFSSSSTNTIQGSFLPTSGTNVQTDSLIPGVQVNFDPKAISDELLHRLDDQLGRSNSNR